MREFVDFPARIQRKREVVAHLIEWNVDQTVEIFVPQTCMGFRKHKISHNLVCHVTREKYNQSRTGTAAWQLNLVRMQKRNLTRGEHHTKRRAQYRNNN